MQVVLSDKEVMWFLPGKVHLTYEAPRAELDIEKLNSQELKTLALSIKAGTVSVSDIEKVRSKLKASAPKPSGPVVVDPMVARRALLKSVQEDLAVSVNEVKQRIERATDMIYIRELLEVEKKGKARKSILVAASTKLDALAKEVQSVVGTEPVGFSNPDDDGLEVQDSETEEVTFTIPEELAFKK